MPGLNKNKENKSQKTEVSPRKQKLVPEFGILGPSAVANMERSSRYFGCKIPPVGADCGEPS